MRHPTISRLSFWWAVITMSAGCRPQRPTEEHLIPGGFEGPVVIIFSPRAGQNLSPNENREVLYRIGLDGMAVALASAPPSGWRNVRYFYHDVNGTRIAIPVHADSTTLQVFGDVVGVTSTLDGRPVDVRWQSYFVGVPAVHTDWGVRREEAVEKAVQAFLSGPPPL